VAGVQRERLAPERFDVDTAQEHVPSGRRRVDRHPELATDRLEPRDPDQGHRRVHVRAGREVAVADDPESGAQVDVVAEFLPVRR
jgi:hypothetical protein